MSTQKLKEMRDDFSRMFGMMAGSTNPRSGRMVMAEAEMLRLLNFVQQVPDLIDLLEAAERERDEAIAAHRKHAASLITERGLLRGRAEIAEAELARRDAAALEPVGYIDPASMRKYRGVMPGGSWSSTPRGGKYNQTLPIYTAPPAASAPEGWAMVPVEPTQRMIDAHTEGMVSGGATRAYRDMMAAAPAPGGVDA